MLSSRNFLMLAGLGALLATFVLFAGVVIRQGGPTALPAADAAPATSTSSTSTTSTTTSSATPTTTGTSATSATTSTSADSGAYATDSRGFVDSAARCDDGQTAVAVGHTQRSLVVICSVGSGYQYRGVRVSDGAGLKAAATATSDGFEAETDGSVYSVSPTELLVTAGGKVIYRDTWIQYRQQPTLSTATTSTATTSTSTSTSTTSTTTSTTASTATSTKATG
ncbi:hypothetical protein [Mycolicibacterium komossense]|uniref:Serine/threonine protein kinase n=1 Tax=Mycolicibacterium komossense TaxID=1779 RepID=A0ABT3CA69_9MYCO|nr:hypothetical protein [Mycolicibacterium komossense]MCV7226340.1 hypothetical protein [Mycolicibacterium komossense]